METTARAIPATESGDQYSLGKILGIWALAAVPMGILGWIVFPALSPDVESDPIGAGVTRFVLITIGLVWLFTLSIVRLEEETCAGRSSADCGSTRRAIRSGETRRRLWMWVIPFLIAIVLWELALRAFVDEPWVTIFPFLAEPPGYGLSGVFQSQELLDRLVGAWWFLGLFVVNAIFNTILGEEFLFRGVLLPKMEGAFGRWSWVANGAMHGFYHLRPWGIAGSVFSGFLYAFPSWRYRTAWMGVIVHSAQSVFFVFLILGVVLGLA